MGIIKAAINSIGGSFADQWLEYIKAGSLDSQTVMSAGVKVRGRDKRNENKEGSADFVSDGSLIEVGVNQFMILTDGGKIVDYTSEPGYYKVDNKNAPSMFNGGFSEAIEETFNRLRFGGVPSSSQKVYFINLQEIKDIAFGTPNPINYFDNFYNAELYLRTNGYFSIRITDPIKFYAEAIPKNMDHVFDCGYSEAVHCGISDCISNSSQQNVDGRNPHFSRDLQSNGTCKLYGRSSG